MMNSTVPVDRYMYYIYAPPTNQQWHSQIKSEGGRRIESYFIKWFDELNTILLRTSFLDEM